MNDTLTLCYHALSAGWPAPLAVTPKAFEEQLELLLARGYEPATFSEAQEREGARSLVVTFDDAFSSVFQLALPIMQRLGVPGTIFVPTAYPDSGRPMAWEGLDFWMGGEHGGELACMSWDDLRACRDLGWEIGAHTHTHPFLTRLDDHALAAELRASREICEREMGDPCESVAYPYGNMDERVALAAGAAGFAHAAALDPRLYGGDPLRAPRIGIYRADDRRRFDLKVSRAIRAFRATPAWHAVHNGRIRIAEKRRSLTPASAVNAEVSLAVAFDLARLV